jgi:voltage-gated potassium channel
VGLWFVQTSVQRVTTGFALVALTCVIATVVYWSAGWDLVDAIYMVVITIFGVGYGEVRPITDPRLKIFTMALVIAGCSSAAYVVGGFVQMIAEGEVHRFLGARRMTQGIDQLKQHTIICGYGRVGQILARELSEAKCLFVIVDTDADRLREAEAAGYLVLIGDATDEKILTLAGIQRARTLATVLPDDKMNVFITLTARELSAELEIIARGESPATERKLLRSGANRVVLLAAIGAAKISQLITRPSAEALLSDAAGCSHLNDELQSIGLQMVEVPIEGGSPLVGQALRSIESAGGGCVVVAIRSANGTIVRHPPLDTTLMAKDTIILLGHRGDLFQLTAKGKAHAGQIYRGARIRG